MPLRSEGRFISLGNVKSGMMVKFSYTKLDGSVGRYTVLVIDPSRKNAHSSQAQLHGLLINDLSDVEILTLLNKVSRVTLDLEERRAPLASLDNDEFYSRYIGALSSQRIYRTFNVDSIGGLQQILLGVPD